MAVWIVAVAAVAACMVQFLTSFLSHFAMSALSVAAHIAGFIVLFLLGAGLEEIIIVLFVSLTSLMLFNAILKRRGNK